MQWGVRGGIELLEIAVPGQSRARESVQLKQSRLGRLLVFDGQQQRAIIEIELVAIGLGSWRWNFPRAPAAS